MIIMLINKIKKNLDIIIKICYYNKIKEKVQYHGNKIKINLH